MGISIQKLRVDSTINPEAKPRVMTDPCQRSNESIVKARPEVKESSTWDRAGRSEVPGSKAGTMLEQASAGQEAGVQSRNKARLEAGKEGPRQNMTGAR